MNTETFDEEQIEDVLALRRDALALKAKSKMDEKASRGILHGCAPLGYKNALVNGEKVIVIDPETVTKVKKLFRLAAKKEMTVRKLVPLAAEMGLGSRNGKSLGASAIHAILTNSFYYGFITVKGKLLSGSHQPLVKGALFKLVQENLSAKGRRPVVR